MDIKPQNIPSSRITGSCNITALKAVLVEAVEVPLARSLVTKMQAMPLELLEVHSRVDDLLHMVVQNKPDVLVLRVNFVDSALLEQLVIVHQESPLPVVVFAEHHAPEAVAAGVESYVVDDMQTVRLPAIIDLAMARFAYTQSLSIELCQTKAKLTERKLIERAKGIIMKQKNLCEEDAYSQMRKLAMDHGQSMAELSKKIIAVFEMLD